MVDMDAMEEQQQEEEEEEEEQEQQPIGEAEARGGGGRGRGGGQRRKGGLSLADRTREEAAEEEEEEEEEDHKGKRKDSKKLKLRRSAAGRIEQGTEGAEEDEEAAGGTRGDEDQPWTLHSEEFLRWLDDFMSRDTTRTKHLHHHHQHQQEEMEEEEEEEDSPARGPATATTQLRLHMKTLVEVVAKRERWWGQRAEAMAALQQGGEGAGAAPGNSASSMLSECHKGGAAMVTTGGQSSVVRPFSVLPDELTLHIFSFLPVRDIACIRPVCRHWASLGDDEALLQQFVAKHSEYPAVPAKPRLVERDLKWVYRSQNHVIDLVACPNATGIGSGRLKTGARYDGEWKDGKEHGYGTKFWPLPPKAPSAEGAPDSTMKTSENPSTASVSASSLQAQQGDGGMLHAPVVPGTVADVSNMEMEQASVGDGTQQAKSEATKVAPPPRLLYDKYEGFWKEGWEHGPGTYTWADGSRFVGDWNEGKRSGEGIYTWPNGSQYIGEWKDGNQEGMGTYWWPSGSLYMGGWKNGNQHGWGMKRWGDSSQYEGEWKDGQKHGEGLYTWIDGRRYSGTWFNGKKHGKGTYTWADGTAYEGLWMMGLRHGKGVMSFADGTVIEGEWWKDRRLRPGEDGPSTQGQRPLYEKPYDHYFSEPDEIWESKYRSVIDSKTVSRKREMEELRKKGKEIKQQRQQILKRFGEAK